MIGLYFEREREKKKIRKNDIEGKERHLQRMKEDKKAKNEINVRRAYIWINNFLLIECPGGTKQTVSDGFFIQFLQVSPRLIFNFQGS